MAAPRLRVDIETYSGTPIEAGVYRYTTDPDFRILMVGYHIDDEPTQVLTTPQDLGKASGWMRDPYFRKVAHNAQFERVCFSTPGGPYLPPEEWHDTMAIAGVRGYPQSLDGLARALGATPKDSAGKRLINLFCKPNRRGERNLPEEYPDEWLEFIEYCRQDVNTLREVDGALGDGWPTEMERRVYLADQRINDRGILIDRDLAEAAEWQAIQNQVRHGDELRSIAHIENPNSAPQIKGWLEERGVALPDLKAETVEKALERSLPSDVARVLELRQELALVASKKFSAALGGVSEDGRLRGQFRYFGAHTGRWSGRGVQLQNLPRESFFTDKQRPGEPDTAYWLRAEVPADAAIVDLQIGNPLEAVELKRLVRPMFQGPFVVVDYAAIEARVVAWLADEQWALDAFRAGRDIYVETAERMSTPEKQLTRSQGKVAVLALGYNGAVASLRAMGATGTDEELKRLVHGWRRANRHIVGLWDKLDEAFYRGGPAGARLTVRGDSENRELVLPSGRSIHYRNVAFKFDSLGRRRATFASPLGYRTDTYGGRLTENATQAVARDVLAEALVRLEDAGYRVVGHVHDEIIVEVPAYAGEYLVEEIKQIMNEPPAWADGLPIDGEGFSCRRYRKG